MEAKGYKAFNSDWTCREKQYCCPGDFEQDGELVICENGLHFCKRLADCFNYYRFDKSTKVAEVIAYGEVLEREGKCCTNKLKIIKEIPWEEVLKIVNIGYDNIGYKNIGNENKGNLNIGDNNIGSYNSGYYNRGDLNTGSNNIGDKNTSSYNIGNGNSGYHNRGDLNTGSNNIGDLNTGSNNIGNGNSGCFNNGNCNTGGHNIGIDNSGSFNKGNFNTGNYNIGHSNSGYFNKTNYSTGCFNTIEQKIYLFNKPSNWTFDNWLNSDAYKLLDSLNNYRISSKTYFDYIHFTKEEKEIIMSIPNFDKDIFKEITGIDIDK